MAILRTIFHSTGSRLFLLRFTRKSYYSKAESLIFLNVKKLNTAILLGVKPVFH